MKSTVDPLDESTQGLRASSWREVRGDEQKLGMPPPVRERYNAKARRSVAGGSTHKNKRLKRAPAGAESSDPNAEIVVPKSDQAKDLDRKDVLLQEVRMQNQRTLTKYLFDYVAALVVPIDQQEKAKTPREVHCKSPSAPHIVQLLMLSLRTRS